MKRLPRFNLFKQVEGGTRRMFEATSNPVYAWELLFVHLLQGQKHPLPRWCRSYFTQTAARIHALAFGRKIGRKPNKVSQAEILDALGFMPRRGERSAIARAKQDLDDMILSFAADAKGTAYAAKLQGDEHDETKLRSAQRRIARGRKLRRRRQS